MALDLDGGAVREARIALGGVATVPWRAREAEAALHGPAARRAALPRRAAEAALRGAGPTATTPSRSELGRRTLVRALHAGAADGGLSMTRRQLGPRPASARGPASRRAKVTGAARYASDFAVGRPAYACLVTSADRPRPHRRASTSARGAGRAGRARHPDPRERRPALQAAQDFAASGYGSATHPRWSRDRIWHDGQIVAVVVAETFEAAREAAQLVRVDYAEETPAADFGAERRRAGRARRRRRQATRIRQVGDAEAAFAAAPVSVEADYATPTQHHNPIELFTTTAAWDGRQAHRSRSPASTSMA